MLRIDGITHSVTLTGRIVNADSMQSPAGGPLDGLLASYCAGTLDPASHVLIASHLILRPENRRVVAALEGLAGDALMQAQPQPFADRDRRLAEIFDEAPLPSRQAAPSGVLPAPLRQFLGQDLEALKWRFKLPGVKEYRIGDLGRGGEASLLLVKAGRRIPCHTHEGSEITLVLEGGFSDATGHYLRGDVAIAGADLDHSPMTDPEGDCLCFAVTDAPLRLTGPVGRIIDRLFRQH
jgi:putative transcriptional regulator